MTKAVAFLAVLLVYGCALLGGCDARSPDQLPCQIGSTCPEEEACPGRCVPVPPMDWSLPVLLWSGPELEAPDCPAGLTELVEYEGHADPVDPPGCPTCRCEPPTGECELPTLLLGNTETCPEGGGGTHFDFSPPDLWDGSCTSNTVIPPELGVRSITFGTVSMTEGGCTPTASPPSPKGGAASAPWKTLARACAMAGLAPCPDRDALCVPAAAPPAGFSQCTHRQGEHECPADYPDRRIFYGDLRDSRHCTDCSCGPPVGGACYAFVTTFRDLKCEELANGLLASSWWPYCFDTSQDSLGSKTADPPYYEPGSCEPGGGEPLGAIEPLRPTTFCCQ